MSKVFMMALMNLSEKNLNISSQINISKLLGHDTPPNYGGAISYPALTMSEISDGDG